MIDFQLIETSYIYKEFQYKNIIIIYCVKNLEKEDVDKYDIEIDICNIRIKNIVYLGEWNQKDVFKVIEKVIIRDKKMLLSLFDCLFKNK